MEIINGADLMVFSNIGTKVAAFACATSCTLSVSAELLETTSKDSGAWKQQEARKLGYSLKSDQLMTIAGYDAVLAKMVAREPVDFEFGVAGNAGSEGMPAEGWSVPTAGYKGKAIITSLELTAGHGEKATYSVSMEGTGPLIPKTATQSTQDAGSVPEVPAKEVKK